MATTVDTLLVRIEADMRDVRRDLAALEKRTETASRSISKSMGRIGAVTQAVIGGVLVQQFARGILSLTNFASDMEEMSSMSEAVFGGFVDSVRNKLGEFGDEVGRSRFELEAMAASVQDTFVPLGFARGQAAELSVELTKLAVDVASFKNELETDVMAAFQSALVGNHEAVRRFGIVITEAELQNELFRMGITENAKQVDAQTKVQARLNLILAGTKDAQGDAARTSGSYANMTRALDAQVKLLANDIGQELLPAMKDLVAITTDSIKGFRNFLRAIGLVTSEHDALIKNIQRVKEAQEAVNKAQEKLAKSPNYAPYLRRAERANAELNAALAEQDALFEPIIDGIMGVGEASDETAVSTENLNKKLSDGESIVNSLILELQKLKANQNDSTGITADLLDIQAKLGDEYGKYASVITELLEKIHAFKTEQEEQANKASKLADSVREGADALREYREAQKEAQVARVVSEIQKQLEAAQKFKDVLDGLAQSTRLLKLERDGATESEIMAQEIIAQLELTTRQQTDAVRAATAAYVEAQKELDETENKLDDFKDSVQRGIDFVKSLATEQERLSQKLADVGNAYAAGAISATEFEEAQDRIAEQLQALDPMFQALRGALQSVSTQISQQFADMVMSGKLSLDSLQDIFSNFVRTMISKAFELMVMNRIINAAFGLTGGNALPTANIDTNAGGGSISRPSIVGERGPELFIPHSAGVIKNNMDTKNMLGGQTTVVNQTLNIETGVSQTVRAEIVSLLPTIQKSTISAIVDQRRRGGAVASAFGA